MHVPHDQLAPDTLAALVDDFVTREGAVHGHTDYSIEQRRDAVLRQLRDGSAVIVFDEEDESVSIVTRRDSERPGDVEQSVEGNRSRAFDEDEQDDNQERQVLA